MTVRVVVPSTVKRQINAIDDWWRENRLAAPALFTEELAAALTLLSNVPHAGKIYPEANDQLVRRLLLRSTRYHVYYRTTPIEVIVLSVWSAVRGSGPDLK